MLFDIQCFQINVVSVSMATNLFGIDIELKRLCKLLMH